MVKPSPQEEYDRELRRLEFRTEEWRKVEKEKLLDRKYHREMTLAQRIATRFLQISGIAIGLFFIWALVFGDS